MFDPASITLGQVSSSIRDFAIVGVLIGSAWKARGGYDIVRNFFERTTKHMDVMEQGMQTLLTNHLAHIEIDLRNMASRQIRASEAQEAEYVVADAASNFSQEL